MDSLETVSGRKKGSKLYVHENKAYFVRQRRNGKVYLACQDSRQNGCEGWLRVEDKPNVSVTVTKPHSEACTVSPDTINILRAEEEMKHQAENSVARANL